jgi:hypothetical protein
MEVKKFKSNPFRFVSAINYTKEQLHETDISFEEDYQPFLINRSLSYFPDTVQIANEINVLHYIPKKWQFSFLLNMVAKKKRYSNKKWAKRSKDSNEPFIMEYYNVSSQKAREILSLLSKDKIEFIKSKFYKGGTNG